MGIKQLEHNPNQWPLSSAVVYNL